MSNLENNSLTLQTILSMVNALPESTDLTPIIDALTEKGQTVPEGADVDVLASLIAAIETGGGGATATWGLVTPASTDIITIEHGLGKRPVVWGAIYASNFNGVADKNLCGHKTNMRLDASTGIYTKTSGAFSQPAKNVSAYNMWGTREDIPMDTETSEEITVKYSGVWYANKNFLKFKPLSSREQEYVAVGDTYIWYILGVD